MMINGKKNTVHTFTPTREQTEESRNDFRSPNNRRLFLANTPLQSEPETKQANYPDFCAPGESRISRESAMMERVGDRDRECE